MAAVQGLEARLVELHSQVHRGAYRVQASRRVYIPKADGRQRPLGVASLEDKIVQQVIVTILNQIYEVDFRVVVVPSGTRPTPENWGDGRRKTGGTEKLGDGREVYRRTLSEAPVIGAPEGTN